MNKILKQEWLGFALIAVIYTVNFLFIREKFGQWFPREVRAAVLVSSIFAVYGAGIYAFYNNNTPWMLHLWHLLHIVLIGMAGVMMFYDKFVEPIRPVWRSLLNSLTEMLVSPTLLVAMLLLRRYLVSQEQAKQGG